MVLGKTLKVTELFSSSVKWGKCLSLRLGMRIYQDEGSQVPGTWGPINIYGWYLGTGRPLLAPAAPSCPPASLALVNDVLTMKHCYLKCRDHENVVLHYLMELVLEDLVVLTVLCVLLHQQVTKLKRHSLPQVDEGESG